MKVNAITNSIIGVNTEALNNSKAQTKGYQTQPKFDEAADKNASKASMNYFLGAQNVPSFKGYPCSTGAFVVKQIDNVPCACCGKEMMNGKEQNEFVAKAAKSVGQELADVLNANMHKFRRNEKAIARHLSEEAIRKPDKRLGELFEETQVMPKQLFDKENKIVLDGVDAKAKELYGEENAVSKFVQAQKAVIDNPKKTFVRNDFLADLQKQSPDPAKTQKLLNVAIELPLELRDIEKIFGKYQGQPSEKVARRLISTAAMTTEHIHPKSKGGPNDTENYMGECAECNNNRGSKDLNGYWQEVYPNMPSAVQTYNDFITDKIIKGEMGVKYEDYPLDLEKAVETESKGVIDLKVLNPEEIDKIRKEKGLPDPQPRADVVYNPAKGDVRDPKKDEEFGEKTTATKPAKPNRKPGGRKPSRKPNRK